ncbi:MAG TPA: hypothetical protein VLZ12_01050 [Verrucomicrobiae bacterium]|nr:hypothetical protein [Verrucomicrobiae bacterium]
MRSNSFWRGILGVATTGIAVFQLCAAEAQTNSWIDGNGKWENPTNWSRGVAPSTADSADLITNAGNHVVTIDFATTTNAYGASLTINNLTVSSNTLFLANAGLTTPLQIVASVTGLRVNSGGSVVISNSFLKIKSQTPYVDGSLLLNGGLLVQTNPPLANTFYVGLSAAGRLTVSNGTMVTESMAIESGTFTAAGGTNINRDLFQNFATTWITGGRLVCTGVVGELRSQGQTTVSNGTILANYLNVGVFYSEDGTFTVNGGTTLVSSNLLIGGATNALGTVTVTGGSLYVTNSDHTGQTEVRYGTLVLTSGVFVTDSLLVTNPNGSFVNSGGSFSVTGPAHVNQGTQTVASGSTTLSSNLWVGSTVGSTGTVNVTGGMLTVTNGVFAIGNDGSLFSTGGVGHVNVSSGLVEAASILIGDRFDNYSGFTVTGNGHVLVRGGFRSNGIRTTTVDGGTLEVVDGPPPPFEDPALHDRIVVAYEGDGRMIVSNGAVRVLEMVIGLANGRGTFEMAGGSVNLSSNLLVGMNSSATGNVFITGGSVVVTNGVFGVGNNGTVGGTGGLGLVAVSNGLLEAASVLVGDNSGNDSGFTVAGGGHVLVHGGFRSNGIRTTTINGGMLEVVEGPPPPFEDSILHDRIVVSYLADGKLVVSNGTVRTPGMLVGASAGKTGTLLLAGGTASVFSNMTVGWIACSSTGIVNVTGGDLYVTNAAGNASLEVRSGTFTLSSGTVVVDRLVMTNACGLFVRNGGTLIVSSMVLAPNLDADGDGIPNGYEQTHGLDPLNAADDYLDNDGDGLSNQQEYLAGTDANDSASAFRITSVLRLNNDIRITWMMGPGKTNALQAATATGYTTNMTDIFSVTNTVGTVTNYLDVGGATNKPARYYRVRLVP